MTTRFLPSLLRLIKELISQLIRRGMMVTMGTGFTHYSNHDYYQVCSYCVWLGYFTVQVMNNLTHVLDVYQEP